MADNSVTLNPQAAGENQRIDGVGLSASPSAVSFQNKLYVLHQGSGKNGQLWYTTSYDGSSWSGDQQVANVGLSDSPSGVVFRGTLYVFHQGSGKNGQLRYVTFNGSTWSGDQQVPNVGMSASPSAVVFRDTLYVFHHGSGDNGTLWYTTFNGTSWSSDRQVANVSLTDSPSAVVFRDTLYVFHQGSRENGQFWYTTFNGSTWSGDQRRADVSLSASPSAIAYFDEELYIFHQASGNTGKLMYLVFNGSSWTADQLVYGPSLSWSPSAVVFLSTLSIYYQGGGENGQLWRYVFDDLEIVGIDYHMDQAKLANQTPVVIDRKVVENKTEIEQPPVSTTLSGGVEQTSWFENSKTSGVSLEKGREFTVSIPIVEGASVEAGTSLKLGLSKSQTWAYGESNAFTQQYSLTLPVVAPPHSVVTATAIVSKGNLDVPYTMALKTKTGSPVTTEGIWSGITSWDVKYTLEQTELP